MSLSGDDWKEGTPYEEEEDRRRRELREAAEELRKAFQRMVKARLAAFEARIKILRPLAMTEVREALMAEGIPEDEARDMVQSTVTVAAAEGRNQGLALLTLIREVREDG